MADLDSLVDMVSDDVDFNDMIQNKPIEASEPEAPVEETEVNEAFELADDDYEDAEAEEELPQEEDSRSGDDDELVEVEWYGKKGKASKEVADYMDTYFTKKNQDIAERRRAWEAERDSELQRIEQERVAVEERQRMLQQHLDDNPEFAESWQESEAIAKRDNELSRKVEELAAFKESFEQERQTKLLNDELIALGSKYKLADSRFTPEEINDLAIAAVIKSNYTIELEHAYQSVVASKNRGAKAKSLNRLRTAVDKSNQTESLSSRGRSSPTRRTRAKGPASLDALLNMHLKKDDSFFQ